jgi:hypothetical protein
VCIGTTTAFVVLWVGDDAVDLQRAERRTQHQAAGTSRLT